MLGLYVVHPCGATFNCNAKIIYLMNLVHLNYFIWIWYQSIDQWWRNQFIGVQNFAFDRVMMGSLLFYHLVITNSDIGALIYIPMDQYIYIYT